MIPNERLQDQSIYYWLKSIVPSGVNITDAFPTSVNSADPDLVLPTVSIDAARTQKGPLELGNYVQKQDRFWSIDVFAKNKTQRDDLAYLISNELEKNIPVFDYNEGFPPTFSPTQLGGLDVTNINLQPIYVFRDLVKTLYWRTKITFVTLYRSF
jgi:hypothetical protein